MEGQVGHDCAPQTQLLHYHPHSALLCILSVTSILTLCLPSGGLVVCVLGGDLSANRDSDSEHVR